MHLLLAHSLKLAITLLPLFSWLSLGIGTDSNAPFANTAAQEVREEINRTVTLAPNSQVKLSGINGGVNIETWNGNQAEIRIVITASDREALARRPLLVEETGNSLTIRTDDRGDRDRDHDRDRGYVRHQVRLRLPNSIHLNVSGVNGGLDVGEITGTVTVIWVYGVVLL
jgi:hypothetical protein